MERPLCSICNTKHFVREPHVFKVEVPTLEDVLRVKPRANGETPLDRPVIPVAIKSAGVDRPERWPSKSKFDRAAYQREYMREYMKKRRAKP